MANEAQLRLSLNINGPGVQRYQSQPTTFNADISIAGGPSPGEFLATKNGTDVNLSALRQPGLTWLMNLGVDASGASLLPTAGQSYSWPNYVEYGIFDHNTNQFYPLGEILPGECYPIRLSRFINSEIGTGSGTTTGPDTVTFRMKAIGTACKVVVSAFER